MLYTPHLLVSIICANCSWCQSSSCFHFTFKWNDCILLHKFLWLVKYVTKCILLSDKKNYCRKAIERICSLYLWYCDISYSLHSTHLYFIVYVIILCQLQLMTVFFLFPFDTQTKWLHTAAAFIVISGIGNEANFIIERENCSCKWIEKNVFNCFATSLFHCLFIIFAKLIKRIITNIPPILFRDKHTRRNFFTPFSFKLYGELSTCKRF